MAPKKIGKRIIDAMKEKGLKLTRQRAEIIGLIAMERSHPSARTIFRKARAKMPTISLSTVYYTLGIMKSAGLIRELEFDNWDSRYEGDVSDHLNLVCTSCGKIEDFRAPLPVPLEEVEKRAGFRADSARFEYYGLCRKCRSKIR
jgi:Fur family peroxide stress response transcriptional regulator